MKKSPRTSTTSQGPSSMLVKLRSVQDKNGAVSKLMHNADIAILNKYVRDRDTRTEMYAGRVACWLHTHTHTHTWMYGDGLN